MAGHSASPAKYSSAAHCKRGFRRRELTGIWKLDGTKLVHSDTGVAMTARHKGLLQELPEDAMPTRPRGDAKERTFNLLIRDGIEPRANHPEAALIGKHAGDEERAFSTDAAVPEEYRRVFGEILDDHYVIEG